MRITTFYPNTHFIFVAIRKTVGTLAESTDSTNTIKKIYVCQYHQKQDKECPLPDNKERSKNISATQQQDNQDKGNIETTS